MSERQDERTPDGGVTRRKLLMRGVQAGAGMSLAGTFLAACGGGGGGGVKAAGGALAHGLSALPGGTPRRGGTMTLGATSGGSGETLFPGLTLTTGDFTRAYQLYNSLFYPGTGESLVPLAPGLALSAESNADATTWTLKLRDGVHWHDGKPFTADDVVWNARSLWSDQTNFAYGTLAGVLDFKGVRKRDNLTVEMPLQRPLPEFPTLLTAPWMLIVQGGQTLKDVQRRAIGTGPFVYKSFDRGRHSVFTANKEYWEQGKPYIDELVVDSSFTDDTALFNALLAKNVDVIPGVPLTTARAQLSTKQVQILEGPPISQTQEFSMRVDKGPFTDVRVRQAFQLLVDRQAMINSALAGFGTPADDLAGKGAKYFATDLKRERDVEKAKSLFKAAGVLGHTFTLPTANAWVGLVEAATVLAQQAAQAGVKVNVQKVSPASYFQPAAGFGTRPFAQNSFLASPSLTQIYRSILTKGAPFNETHWGDQPGGAAAVKLIDQATSQSNEAKAKDLWHAVQEQQFNQGGYVIWATYPWVDAAANNVRGLKAGAGFYLNTFRLLDGWLA